MAQCKHHKVCGLDALHETEEGLCILHSQDPSKDRDEFKRALEAHCGDKGKIDNFRFFVFPERFDLSRLTFGEKADFFKATFGKKANFQWATFGDGASFLKATFGEKADFREATFGEKADFFKATFGEKASFLKATFGKEASLNNATFGDGTSFTKATFGDGVSFTKATFGKEVSLNKATFGDGALFTEATFGEKADFREATFGDGAHFTKATFGDGVDLSGATFREKAYFRETKFLGRAIFAGKEEEEKVFQIFSGAQMDFRNAISDKPEALVFRDADLRMCRFLGMDLRHIEFAAVTWVEIPVGCFIIKKTRTAVYDEVLWLEGETTSLYHIEKLYRELKQNYEDRRDYDRASGFHYGEQEMRRKNPVTPWGSLVLLWLYWLLSGYGELCLRPLSWFGGLLLLSTFGYLCLGLKHGGSELVWNNISDIGDSALYSFRVMTFLKPEDLSPVGWGARSIHTIDSTFGPVLIGLFALALRQRLKR